MTAWLLPLILSSLTFAGVREVQQHRILFLCSGNYYRSRLAEAVFNFRAEQRGLDWRATSRAIRRGPLKPGQQLARLSPHARKKLRELNIPLRYTAPEPARVTSQDLDGVACVIAMNEREHRPVFNQMFGDHHRYPITYWHHDDVQDAAPDAVLPGLVAEVYALVDNLARGHLPVDCRR